MTHTKPSPKKHSVAASKQKQTLEIVKKLKAVGAPKKEVASAAFTLDDVQEVIQQNKQVDAEIKSAEAHVKHGTKKRVIDVKTPKKPQVHGAASLSDILGGSFEKLQKKGKKETVLRKVPEQWQKYYEQLIQLREQVKVGLEMHEKDAIGVSVKEATGDLSGYGVGDTTGDAYNLDMALGTVSTDRELLEEIESAILRIHDGSYGVCEITGAPILKQRLQAVPFTRYSLEGQRQLETMKAQRANQNQPGLNFADEDDALPVVEEDAEE